jgi:pimeloyl-ACP methyl ester carboxylesterase
MQSLISTEIIEIQSASPAGPHVMRVQQAGDPQSQRVAICVHGLTRVSDDFLPLAQRLVAQGYRVLMPDVVGRGRSDWLKAAEHYHIGQYVADVAQMARQLKLPPVAWVGTSMGGLMAMVAAGHPQRETFFAGLRIQRLVLNDAGAMLAGPALDRIGLYVGESPVFDTLEAARAMVRSRLVTFGTHSQEQWDFLTDAVLRSTEDGSWRLHYDPAIAAPFKAALLAATGPTPDADFWPLYEAITCPTLLLRGAESDLLPRAVAEEMTRRGPKATLLEFAGVGHAPTLLSEDQMDPILSFLSEV